MTVFSGHSSNGSVQPITPPRADRFCLIIGLDSLQLDAMEKLLRERLEFRQVLRSEDEATALDYLARMMMADLIIVDYPSMGAEALSFVRKLRSTRTRSRVLMIVPPRSRTAIEIAFTSGAHHVVSEDCSGEAFVTAAKEATEGTWPSDPSIGLVIRELFRSAFGKKGLSHRDLIIVTQLSEGLPPKSIAMSFGITPSAISRIKTRFLKRFSSESSEPLQAVVARAGLFSSKPAQPHQEAPQTRATASRGRKGVKAEQNGAIHE